MKRSLTLFLTLTFVVSITDLSAGAGQSRPPRTTSGTNRRADAPLSCTAHVVRTTSASGDVTYSIVCDGECTRNVCRETWLRTYDWKNHKMILTRTCYCDDEVRTPPCCTDEDSNAGVAYLKGKCRVALVYPEGADAGPDGKQSAVPTKDPTGVVCVGDRPVETNCLCRPVSRTVTLDGVKVDIFSCKCYY